MLSLCTCCTPLIDTVATQPFQTLAFLTEQPNAVYTKCSSKSEYICKDNRGFLAHHDSKPVARGGGGHTWVQSTTNMEVPAKNLLNLADQPAGRATPYRIHVLPLLNRRGWKRLFQKCLYVQGRSQWPRCLRRGSAAARLLGLRVRIPPGGLGVCRL